MQQARQDINSRRGANRRGPLGAGSAGAEDTAERQETADDQSRWQGLVEELDPPYDRQDGGGIAERGPLAWLEPTEREVLKW